MAVVENRAYHLEGGEVSAYLDGGLSGTDRTRVEAHLADCAACRAEVIGVSRLLRTAPVSRSRYVPVGLAAAAVLALLLVPRLHLLNPARTTDYREPAVTTTMAPVAVAPRGSAVSVSVLVWTSVPRADRYRVKLIDRSGSPVWQGETADTSVALPAALRLRPGAPYFWRVEARTGWERWVASELQDFTVTGARRP
jgi:anti-sigma factor RsiW